MNKQRSLLAAFIVLISLWFGWSILVNFFIIPTAFKKIPDFFLAGELGIAVFSHLNNLELITGTTLVGILSIAVKRNRASLPLLISAFVLFAISLTYFAYLTPKLIKLTELWKRLDLMGMTSAAGIPDIQQEHQFYHRLYVFLDSIKLLLLVTLLGYGLIKEEKWLA
jgi:hypothetical protein